MSGDYIDYGFAKGVATLTLCRPEAGNSVDIAFVEELIEAIRRARQDDAHVVVLRAQGKAFCVGGDVGGFGQAASPGRLIDDLAEGIHRAVLDLQQLDAVVVSLVQGVAAGAGFPLAAAADLVLATESARFTMAYTKIGLTPDGGSTLLAATLGLHRTLHLALLNPVLSARQAHEAGLVMQVLPDDEAEAGLEAVVQQLLAGSRDAQVGARRLVRAVSVPHPESALRREAVSIRQAADGPDGREGVAAFVGKRPAVFPSAG